MTYSIGTALFSTGLRGVEQIVEEQFGKEGSNYLNSVFGFGYGGYGLYQGIKNGDKNTAQMSMAAILKSALKLLTQIGISCEAAQAKKEVADNTKKADEVTQDVETLKQELEGKISEFNGRLDANKAVIQQALATITDANSTIEEKKQNINDLLSLIQKLQEELAQAETPEKQKEILGHIKNTSLAINNLIAFLPDLQATIEGAGELIAEAEEASELLNEDAVAVEQVATQAITQTVTEGAEAIQENIETATEGATNTANSTIAATGATAALATPATAAKAPQLTKIATDEGAAAGVRIPSAAACLVKIITGIGGSQENTDLLATFKNGVGSALEEHIGFIGDYKTALNPVLTSIGSIQEVQITTAEINSAVDTDLGTISSRGSVVIKNSNPYLTTFNNSNDEDKINLFSTDLITPNVEIKFVDLASNK